MNTEDMVKKSYKNEPRNYGIDLLRMVSMILVAILHVLKQGGILYRVSPFSAQYNVVWTLEIMAYCAVNCYALISGYVGVNSRFKYKNIVKLWLRVMFYTIAITAIFSIYKPEMVNKEVWLCAIFPVMNSQYWYFTAYFCMFFFIPLMNAAVNNLEKKQLQQVIIALITLFSILQTIFQVDTFYTERGYSTIWLIVLYIIGAYIRKYGLCSKTRTVFLYAYYFMMVIITWALKYICEKAQMQGKFNMQDKFLLIRYTSPTILATGVMLLLIFERMKINAGLVKVIKVISPLAFSVYLIHVHPLIWNNIMNDRYVEYVKLPAGKLALAVVGSAVMIYLMCSGIDLVRVGICWVVKLVMGNFHKTISKTFWHKTSLKNEKRDNK